MSEQQDPLLVGLSFGGVIGVLAYWAAEQLNVQAAPLIALVVVVLVMLGVAYWKARTR